MVIPAILEKNWEEIEKKIEACREFANTIHIDFIDGKFAPTTTFMETERFLKYANYFTLEAHIMTDEPIHFLEPLKIGGFKKFIGHVERMGNQVDFVARAQSFGSVGLALDLHTPINRIKVPIIDLDQILLMCVPAGKSGQEFDKAVLHKINQLRDKVPVEVDGGINETTLPIAKKSGASMFCATSFLFKDNPEEHYRILEALL